MTDQFRSGDALFAYDSEMRILLWNSEAERLTGIPAAEALGRSCWEVVRGEDECGAVLCHPGCSGARLAREGWPVPCSRMLIRTETGRKLVSVSTIAVRGAGHEPIVLQLLRNGEALGNGRKDDVSLTRRQGEVLGLLAEGVPAKVIATRLGIAEVTVRNHIQAILIELRCHSQLEAVAEARRRGVL
ncbi:MAG: LuxR C-terminal-related transcriptional regulator [Gaiellaceae bacterium]